MAREENRLIFEDTEKLCKDNKTLAAALENSKSKQELILESDVYEVNHEPKFQEKAEIVISKKRTLAAASAYANQNVKTAVHNFASATNPGGGVVNGSNAQEECLCRCSTLYFNLNTNQMWDGFYKPHRAEGNPIHNDDCIYTPDVMVFKTDTAKPSLMDEKDWFPVDVITCAAPNLRSQPSNAMNPGDGNRAVKIKDAQLLAIHEKRMRRILDIAKNHGDEVVILGAFGCGAFANSPFVVAQAMRKAVSDYLYDFKTIEFAVYCSPKDESNYQTFQRVLKGL